MLYTDWGSFRNWYDESGIGKVVVERGYKYEKSEMSDPMEFTESKDKNNVEIFEGDIVKKFTDYAEVKKENGCFTVEFKHWRKGSVSSYADQIEVVGNIIETPELLRG
jgi:hypothetical protein